MNAIASTLIWVGGALAGISILCFSGLKAWNGWLALRRDQLAARPPEENARAETGARIEMANVRERLRKLEAIARGVDL